MSRNSKPRYVLLQFEEDKTTIVKRTDVVDWLDYGKTIGRATVDGVFTLRNHFILTVRGFYHTFFINNFSGRFLKILKCPDLLY